MSVEGVSGMLAVGLTGGIGAGKSAVAELLVAKGAILIDADVIAREVVAPGGPAYQPMIDRFGIGILDGDGRIDRPTVAAIVFGDPRALADLNAITHPAIGVAMIERREQMAGGDGIVVLDIPLLKAMHRHVLSLDAVVVVDAPMEMVLDRLIHRRGMVRKDAEARIAAQFDRQARLEGADLVVDNSGDERHLAGEVARVWTQLLALQRRVGH
ncbi:MAG: dephospho-CoA kinase [Acidimicrobiales bacterium]